jgi:hypothetical protein
MSTAAYLMRDYNAMTYDVGGKLFDHVPSMPECTPEEFVSMFVESTCYGGVYVIFNPMTRLSKIGVTKGIRARLANLQTAAGARLELMLFLELEPGYDESPTYVERTLHFLYKEKRMVGEWFALDVRDMVAIRGLFYHIEGVHIEENEAFYKKDLRHKLLSKVSA